MKRLINIFIIIFILFLSSCYSNKLNFKDSKKYPAPENTQNSSVAVIINAKFKNDTYYYTNSDVSDLVDFTIIGKKIKNDLDNIISAPLIYFYNLNDKKIKDIKNKYDKIVVIKIDVEKSLNFTLILDYFSIFFPNPAPQWGNYTFNTSIKISAKNDKNTQEFNYKIVSDFSYMLYPVYRTEAQLSAIKKGIEKLLNEMTNNKDLMTLFEKNGEITFTTNYSYIIEEKGVRLVQRDAYSSFPLSIDLRSLFGSSYIKGYYQDEAGNDMLGASGTGFVKEFKIQASTYKPTTKFYASPTVGYYYQDIDIQDFAYDTSNQNRGKEGYIPGTVEERDKNGNIVESFNPYSMNYRSQFSSTYLGGKIGLNLIFGDNIRFLFSPLVYFSLIEARHTTITAGGNEFSDWTFPLGGVVGFNFETGIFFSQAHFGFKMGFDNTFFRKFDFEYDINFNRVITDENQIERIKQVKINRFSIFSTRVFFDFFVVF